MADAVLAGRDVELPGGAGLTHRETVERASAAMDVDDAREEARQKAAYNRWRAEQSEATSANPSVPTPVEAAEAAEVATRAERFWAKRHENSRLLDQARALAAMDALDRGRR